MPGALQAAREPAGPSQGGQGLCMKHAAEHLLQGHREEVGGGETASDLLGSERSQSPGDPMNPWLERGILRKCV